jgi:hypothetical protein
MTLDASGNLGVGTTSPASYGVIAAYKDQTADTAIVVSNNGTATATTSMSFLFNEGGIRGWFRRYRDGSGNTEIGFSDNLLFTGNVTSTKAERARIDASGNLGIGTTSPAAKLEVAGAANVKAQLIQTSTLSKLKLINNSMALGNLSDLAVEFSPAGSGAPYASITSGWITNTNTSFLTFNVTNDGGATLPEHMRITSTGNVGIGTTTPAYKLEVNGATNVNGAFSAVTKSFLINHPVKKNYKLQYGSLESPYHGIRLTGDGVLNSGVCEIQLPDYISALVKENEISIQLTNYQHNKNIWVETIDIENNKFIVKTKKSWFSKKQYKFFWSFTAIRKDVSDMEVEFEVQGDK